jgi:hypothetical protein
MYEEVGPDGRRRVHTVAQVAGEFGVTRPTIYRHLGKLPTTPDTAAALAERLAQLPTDTRPAPTSRSTTNCSGAVADTPMADPADIEMADGR